MRWRGRRESTNVEDRRASSGGLGGGKKTGILGIIILLIGAYYGVDLSSLVGTPDFGMQQSSPLASEEEQELNSLSRVVRLRIQKPYGAIILLDSNNAIKPL